MHEQPMDEERFAERVGRLLSTEESFDEAFERRVLAAVDEAARPWWVRRRTFTLSPARALAMAAGFAGFIVLGAIGTARLVPGRVAVALPAADTVFVVRFVLAAPAARTVAIVGDFNGWANGATLLEPSGEAGIWSISLPLTAGRHEYAFVIDGQQWVADPAALRLVDEFGTESSVLRVGEVDRRGT
jgi:hypothetical protein